MTAAFTTADVCAALGLEARGQSRRFSAVSTDTRTLEEGALFVALLGPDHDGVDFLDAAAARAAAGAIVPRGRERPDLPLQWFPVDDTARALGRLASFHRARAGARVIAVTGSSGKTTVKEMTAAAIGADRPVHRTSANLNNRIGVPLTMLAAPEAAEVWVLELGSSAPGEIETLARIAGPDDAVVTSVGPAHLEGLVDEAGVLEEKLSLVRAARPEGAVVVGERPIELPRAARALRPDARVAGLGEEADFVPDDWTLGPAAVEFVRGGVRYQVPAGGEHHLRDALIAAAVADAIGVEPAVAAAGLAGYAPVGMRGALRHLGALTVVADCYNANPDSFEAAIDYCAGAFPGRRLAAAVGSMLELGSHSGAAHRRIATRLVGAGFACVAVTGEFREAFEALTTANDISTVVLPAEGPEQAGEILANRLAGDEVVLIKGSRGAHMESALERLEARFAGAAAC